MIFRTITATDLENYKKGLGFTAQKQERNLKKAISQVVEQLSYAACNPPAEEGGIPQVKPSPSCWVSCTKDFCLAIKHYDRPRYDMIRPDNIYRQRVAVIKGEGETSFAVDGKAVALEEISGYYDSEIDSAVLDVSTRQCCRGLLEAGAVLDGEGNPFVNGDVNEIFSYAPNVHEVLVANRVAQEEILAILTPLQADMLYALMDAGQQSDFEACMAHFLAGNLPKAELTAEQTVLHHDLYEENKYLVQVIKEVVKRSVDVLRIYALFLRLKREIIAANLQALADAGVISAVPERIGVGEDHTEVFRVGGGNSGMMAFNMPNTMPDNTLVYGGVEMVLPEPKYDDLLFKGSKNSNKILLLAKYDGEEMGYPEFRVYENTFLLEGNKIITAMVHTKRSSPDLTHPGLVDARRLACASMVIE